MEKIDYENEVFEFEKASYLTEFDDGYDPNEDPDFENMNVDTDDDTDEESEHDDGAYEDSVICFRGKELSLGPCYHDCCRVWRLKPIRSSGPKMDFSAFNKISATKGIDQALLDVENNWMENDDPAISFQKHHGELTVHGCTDQECEHPSER